jgi:uncharacterized membrane protein
MTREQQIGRTVVAFSFAAIGLESLLTGHLPAGLLPLRSPLPAALAGLLGAAFAAAVVAAGFTTRYPRAAWIGAAFPTLAVVLLHLPRLITEYKDPLLWSSLLQMLAIIAGILYLGNDQSLNLRNLRTNLRNPLLNLCNLCLWSGALIGFGIQHFMYPGFIAGLIPAWMPARALLAWATGIGFELAAVSFLLRRYDWLAGRLLAFMFWSWVLMLHIPLIAAKPDFEPQWTSGLIALGLGGVALLAGSREERLPEAFRPS